jgi:hypothetical protein
MGLPGFCGRLRMTSEPAGYWELKAVAGAETGGTEMLYAPAVFSVDNSQAH